MKIFASSLAGLLAVFSSHTYASLIFSEFDATSGTGLGTVNTVLTIERDPQAAGPESGCVAWDGTMDIVGPSACPPDSGLNGGDETAITETRSISEVGIATAFNLRVVFNFNERQAGEQVDNIVLDDLILTIYAPDGSICFSSGPFAGVQFDEPASGTGNAGFVFRLDAAQASEAEACFQDSDNRLGLAAAATNGSSQGGPETFYIADVSAITSAVADLAITKTDSEDPVATDSSLTYTLTVTNDGPNNAEDVTVTDTLPPSVTFQSATPSQGSCSESGGTVQCDLGQILAGDQATIDITVTTGSSDQTITNTASVTGSVDDPDTSNNTATEQTVVGADSGMQADVSIIKNDSPDPVVVGETLTYTLIASNAGPDTAVAVVVNDTLPASLAGISASTPDGTCSVSGQTVSCDLGDLAAGTSETVTITATATEAGTLQNTGTVGSDTSDPNTDNNSDAEQTQVVTGAEPAADLAVAKTDDPDPVAAGGTITYTLTIANNGPDTAVNVQLVDNLPASVTNPTATASDGSCTTSGQVVSCQLGDIADGQQETVTITVTAPNADTTVTNSATVGSDTTDPDTSNNSATEQTSVGTADGTSADLSIIKNDTPDPVVAGERLTYTLIVSNAGPDTAVATTVSDTLPATVSSPSAMASSGSCSVDGRSVSCQLGDLAAGAQATVAIEVTPTEPGTIDNVAQVGSDTVDPNTANNNDTEQTQVNAPAGTVQADIVVTKTDSADPVTVGQSFSYTVTVSNQGPDDATGVEVTDTVPAEVSIDGVSPSQGSCVNNDPQVSCQLGALASGASATVVITVTADTAGSATNTAAGSSDQPDPDTGNNSASETTVVSGGAPPTQEPEVVPAMGPIGLLTLVVSVLGIGLVAVRLRS